MLVSLNDISNVNVFEASPKICKSISNGLNSPRSVYNKENLDYLFSFILSSNQLNDVLTGYFKSIVDSLWQQKPKEIYEYFYNDQSIALNFLSHIYSRSVSADVSNRMTLIRII